MDTLTRRRFLIASGVAGGGRAGRRRPARRAGRHPRHRTGDRPAAAGRERTLVLVTLYGGNDGLATVVPYADPAYHDARPDLAYAAGQVLDARRPARAQPGDHGPQAAVRRQAARHRPRRRLPEAGPQPLPVDGHLADRQPGPARRTPAGSAAGWTRGGDPRLRGLVRAGAAAAAGRGHSAGAAVPLRGARRCRPGRSAPASRRSAQPSPGEPPLQAWRPGASPTCVGDRRRSARPQDADDRAGRGRRRRPAGDRHRRRAGRARPAQLDLVARCVEAGVPTRVFSVRSAASTPTPTRRAPRSGCSAELDTAVAGLPRPGWAGPTRGAQGRRAGLLRVRPAGARERLRGHRPRHRRPSVRAGPAGAGGGFDRRRSPA